MLFTYISTIKSLIFPKLHFEFAILDEFSISRMDRFFLN